MNENKPAGTSEERAPLLSENYYAVIPAPVFFDKELAANEKLLYGVLSCLAQREGYCWATNERLATAFSCGGHEVTSGAVEKWLAKLKKRGHIRTQILTKKGKVVGRRIYMRTALPAIAEELDISDEISPRKKSDTPKKEGVQPPKKIGGDKKEGVRVRIGASGLFDSIVNEFPNRDDGSVRELESAIEAFCEMRRKKRAPLSTERATKGIAKKLLEYSGGDIQVAIAVLDHSTECSYTGVYPLKSAPLKPVDEPRKEDELW